MRDAVQTEYTEVQFENPVDLSGKAAEPAPYILGAETLCPFTAESVEICQSGGRKASGARERCPFSLESCKSLH